MTQLFFMIFREKGKQNSPENVLLAAKIDAFHDVCGLRKRCLRFFHSMNLCFGVKPVVLARPGDMDHYHDGKACPIGLIITRVLVVGISRQGAT